MERNIIPYMKSENYGIVYDADNKVYIITDRNSARVCEKNFIKASDAVSWAEDNYKVLV